MKVQTLNPLALFVRNAREAAKLSLGELERRSGVARPQIYRIEQGQSPNPGMVVLGKLARGLDVDAEALYEAHWKTNQQPLPGASTYLRSRYQLTDDQIERVESLIQSFDSHEKP